MKKIFLTLTILSSMLSAMAQGVYIEYKISSAEGMAGTTKTYSQGGNSRTESLMHMGQAGDMDISILMLKSAPQTVYMLSEKDKTYSEVSSDNSKGLKDHDPQEYEVTVIGKEKVNGFNATHVKVRSKASSFEEELWTSTDVVNYTLYMDVANKYTSNNLFKALSSKGAIGFPVRMKVGEHGHAIQIDLLKYESRNNPASLFSLAGYTKSENQAIGGSATQDMLKKMQNMTPEERQKMIEELQKKYQKN